MKKKAILMFSTLLFVAAPLTTVKADSYHSVQTGDTLWSIGSKYNISVSKLLNYNNLNSNSIIYPGQKLKVKESTATSTGTTVTSSTYKVKPGDTLWGIANKNKVTVQQIMTWNKLSTSSIKVGQDLKIGGNTTEAAKPTNPTPDSNTSIKTYTVKVGDTLWGISRETKLSVNDIMKLNNLKSTTLVIGQKLKLNEAVTIPTPSNNNPVYAEVVASSLNLRDNPNGNVIATMPRGSKVQIVSTSNGWNKIVYNGKTGYASIEYLKLVVNNSTDEPKEETRKYLTVSASALNLRASINGNVLTIMPNGAKVELISTSSGWSKIKYGTYTGWASSQYLSTSTSNNGNSSNNGNIVLLDPGHGGIDSGAVNGSYYEKHLVMTFANKTKNYLENMGYKVYLTRDGDESCLPVYVLTPDLQCRVDQSASLNADIFVSIHINAAVPGAIGTETYYNSTTYSDGSRNGQPANSEKLARSIHNRYQPAMQSSDRGVHNSNFYVLRKNQIPSTLLELGFISDSRDLNKLINNTYQNNVSQAIANGINDYFN